MTVTPIRLHTRTAEPVDVEALTEAELRVVFYAAKFHRTYDDLVADDGVGRMLHTITTVVGELGLDLIREVGYLAGHAVLTHNAGLQAHLFPDTNQWNWTETDARVFLRAVAHNPPVLTVHTITQRWHAALAGGTRTAEAVA